MLSKMGYLQMAAGHQAKYGPGVLQQINETVQDLKDNGFEKEFTEEVNYYRQEMVGCTVIYPQERDQLLADFNKS